MRKMPLLATASLFIVILCIIAPACLSTDDQGAQPGTTMPSTSPPEDQSYPDTTRQEAIPSDSEKCSPSTDAFPPQLHSDEYEAPIPLPAPVNTAGAEDSPFVLPGGNTLYFFFTPDVSIPPEQQLLDNVTGIWVTTKSGTTWSEPKRVWLSDPGTLALDGAMAIQGDEMFFASAREGYTGMNLFTATLIDGAWQNWSYAGERLNAEILAGECHLHGDTLYFHSELPGGQGGYDIWTTERVGSTWSDPVPVDAVNSPGMDGFPFVSTDGNELWFTRKYGGTPALYRSIMTSTGWGEPELIVSQFAGEPTLDDEGTLYFVHHYYRDNAMLEADIYVAYKK